MTLNDSTSMIKAKRVSYFKVKGTAMHIAAFERSDLTIKNAIVDSLKILQGLFL
ncbi:MAG: hypothetical protein RIR12_605 [Bacteroidota bacterium]|jgi:hypothetical protein